MLGGWLVTVKGLRKKLIDTDKSMVTSREMGMEGKVEDHMRG